MPFPSTKIKDIATYCAVWIGISSVLASFFALFISAVLRDPFLRIFLIAQLMTHCTVLLSAVIRYSIGYPIGLYLASRFSRASMFAIFVSVTLLSLPAAGIGFCLGYRLAQKYIGHALLNDAIFFTKLFIPSLIISTIISLTTSYVEYLIINRSQLKRAIHKIKSQHIPATPSPAGFDKLVFKENDEHIALNTKDIIYLSSHRKKTIVHTEERDYEIAQLLKNTETKLPQALFMRVHKQFVINLQRIVRLRYFAGGRYIVMLNDSDESTLPVGKSYYPALKKRMQG